MADKVDLSLIGQADPSNKDYYLVKITGLKLDSNYDAKFQWSFQDQSLNNTVANIWSNSYNIVTNTETVPGAPSVSVPSTSVGNIPITLTSYPANALRVNVYVIGGEFGAGKVADYFLAAGTKTISVVGGTYQVALITVNQSGINGDPTNTFTINVSQPGETVQAPTNPNGFTSKRILAGIEVSWAGTYANSTFTGFEAINIYAGNSATATAGTYEQVGVLTGNNVKNTIVIPLGTYVVYGQPVYIHAAAVNRSNPPVVGTIQANVTNQALGPGKATDADINDGAVVIEKLASNVLTVGNLKAGDINATSFIRAGSGNSGARVEISSANISGGPAAGFYIYNSAGAAVLSAPLSGGLSINGGGTFSGSLSAASGTFGGNITASNGLFSVSNGVLTAQSGTIGGWNINETQLRSSGAITGLSNYITLNPATPRISLVKVTADQFGGTGTLTIDPVEGIKDSAGNFELTPAGILTLKGSLTISTNPTYNYWKSTGFRAGAENTYLTTNVSTGVTTIYSSDTTTDTTDGNTSGIPVPQKIEVTSSSITIQGLPGVGDGLTRYGDLIGYTSGVADSYITQYRSAGYSVAGNEPSATYGAAARYRMIVADPYDYNKLKRGFGVYYGVRTQAPTASTGFVGDVWISW
jgi:hypothetical protein